MGTSDLGWTLARSLGERGQAWALLVLLGDSGLSLPPVRGSGSEMVCQLSSMLMGARRGDLAGTAAILADRARLFAAQAATGGPEAVIDACPAAGVGEEVPDLAMVRRAKELEALSGAALRLAVERAYASGHTWQEISDLLGISPQAAFQRFGRLAGAEADEPVTPVITDAADRAIAVLADWFEGRYNTVAATFDAAMAEKFPMAGLAAARAQLAGTAGRYRRLGDDEPLVRQLGDYTVADVPLVFETGPRKGRVAFDRAGRVAGLYVLPSAMP